MKYMGSKNRIAKEILPIILKNRKEGQFYIEPFVGGANIIDKVENPRIGIDINKYLIALLNAMSTGWQPPKVITEELYKRVKDNQNQYPDYLVGFIGICCSFGAKWFGGYARGKKNNGESRKYALESYNNILKQSVNLKEVVFRNITYSDFEYPDNSVIYCDPPYESTTKYKDSFDHSKFWNWVRNMTNKGHTVFVSEYNAPEDFECVWEKEVTCSIQANAKEGEYKKSVEKLFKFTTQSD